MEENQETRQDFSSYLVQTMSMGLVAHGVGLGSALGIFDVICGFTEPKTCEAIAKAGSWKPRYIKEWLGLMVTGKIINYYPHSNTYYIPKHRQDVLSHKGKALNASVFIQGLHNATQVTPELKSCFPSEGPPGIPYSSYDGFHKWRKELRETNITVEMLKSILFKFPDLTQNLERGIQVVEGGCSSGHQCIILAENYPRSSFLGFEIDTEPLDTARSLSEKKGLKNIQFELQDGCNLPQEWTGSFDLFMVWDVVHDVPQSKKFLREIYRVLKPGGMFFMNDVNIHTDVQDNMDVSFAPVAYGMSLYHCMPVSLGCEGEGLGAAWGVEKQEEYMKDAGFTDIKLLPIEVDNAHSYFISYKPKIV